MRTSYCFCSRVSVRRVARALQTPQRCASHAPPLCYAVASSEAATTIPCGMERI
jgi:hypothetical protein